MPKALLLPRTSGLYVRFLVPFDVRPVVGSRFLVRPLHTPPGDRARLVAAHLGVALSQAFNVMRTGARVDLDKLFDAITKNHQDLVIGRVDAKNGDVFHNVEVNTPEDEAMLNRLRGVETPPAKPKANTDMRHQFGAHIKDLVRKGIDAKTMTESRNALALLFEIVGDKPVDEIVQDDMRQFLDDIADYPAHASKRPEFRHLKARDAIALARKLNAKLPAGERQEGLSQHAINKYRQRLSVFFNGLVKATVMPVNPLHGIPRTMDEEETGRAFTTTELQKIFDAEGFKAWAKDHPHRWWAPMLGLYTGARINEVCQLYLCDIDPEGEEGAMVDGLHIRKGQPGQKLKGKKSRRFVPLAKSLLDAGFLQYVAEVKAAGHERLFPHLPNNDGNGYGKQMSRQFSTYIKRLGVDEEGMGFHSFRHTLATLLNRKGVTENSIGRITGHCAPKSVLGRYYIDVPTIPERVETLSKFVPPVTLLPYSPGQFADQLKEAHEKPAEWAAAKKRRDTKPAKRPDGAQPTPSERVFGAKPQTTPKKKRRAK